MLLGFGVVLGFAAVSIDVGSLMWERRQVQNGADAAALSMAKTCAEDPAKCVAGGADQPLLDTLNNNNAKDLAGGFDNTAYPSGLCGRANTLPGVRRLDRCAAPTARNSPRVWPPTPSVPYVEAHTQTQGRQRQRRFCRPGWSGRSPAAAPARPSAPAPERPTVRRAPPRPRPRSPSRCASGVRTRPAETATTHSTRRQCPGYGARTPACLAIGGNDAAHAGPGDHHHPAGRTPHRRCRVRTGTATTWPAASATWRRAGATPPSVRTAGSRSTPATARPCDLAQYWARSSTSPCSTA